MKVDWNYSELAKHYDKRADYSMIALKAIFKIMGLNAGDPVADVGAGTGKLTRPMLECGYKVTAVEPNDEMRAFGIQNTKGHSVTWYKASGEETGLEDHSYKAFTMGSSFNVVDQEKCLKEAARALISQGWFVCMWNHRDLENPVQRDIEAIIQKAIPDYNYGTRRIDPTDVISASPDFDPPIHVSHRFKVSMPQDVVIDAWRSHATLQRQAKDKFYAIIDQIEAYLEGKNVIDVPYRTNIWIAQKKV